MRLFYERRSMPTVATLDPDDHRPWLLLDVDGVLNVFNGSQNQRLYEHHGIEVGGVRYKVKMRRDLKDWIFELTEFFVPVWCTMWNEDANTFLAPLLEIPDLPVVPCSYNYFMEDVGPDVHPKVCSIMAHVPDDRALAWVDDEITRHDEAWGFLRDLKTPTRLLKTDERQGLRRDQMDKLIAWAKEVVS